MKPLVSAILLILCIINVCTNNAVNEAIGYSVGSPLYTRFTYMFGHVNLLHLLINIVGIYKLDEFIELYVAKTKLHNYFYSLSLFIIALLAVIATIGTGQMLPTVGLSGVLFVYMGLVAGLLMNQYTIIYIATLLLFNGIGYIIGGMNWMLHCNAFVLGFLLGLPFYFYNKHRASVNK